VTGKPFDELASRRLSTEARNADNRRREKTVFHQLAHSYGSMLAMLSITERRLVAHVDNLAAAGQYEASLELRATLTLIREVIAEAEAAIEGPK
jgi:hypothetical protein